MGLCRHPPRRQPSGSFARLPDRAALARLEVRDNALAAQLVSRCASMDDNTPGRRGVAAIVGWSIAAAVSIVAVVLFGLPLIADRLTPLLPEAFERRLGEVADSQIKTMFNAKTCDNAAGQKAFVKLVTPFAYPPAATSCSRACSEFDSQAFALPGGGLSC